MKHLASSIVVVSVLFFGAARVQEEFNQMADAKAAAMSSLALIDAGEYAKGWQQASGLFQASVSETYWQRAARTARAPLGQLQTRTLKSSTFVHSLPGVPDGLYVVLKYDSRFEHKTQAVETVTPSATVTATGRYQGTSSDRLSAQINIIAVATTQRPTARKFGPDHL